MERERGVLGIVDVFIEERLEFFGGGLERLGLLDFEVIGVVKGGFDGD